MSLQITVQSVQKFIELSNINDYYYNYHHYILEIVLEIMSGNNTVRLLYDEYKVT